MYELTQQFIAKKLADERIPWTARQREMLEGMSTYLGDVEGDFETAIDQTMNPGLQPEVPIPPELEEPNE